MKVQLLHSSIGAAKFINALSEPLPVLWLRETMPIGTANVYIGVNVIIEGDWCYFYLLDYSTVFCTTR